MPILKRTIKNRKVFNDVYTLSNNSQKTKEGFLSKITKAIAGKSTVDEEVLDNLEDALVGADVGIDTTIAIIEQIAEHNREIGRNPNYRAAVSRLLDHALPASSAAVDEYWASRLLNLSHLNLLWQVWEII